jgi:hypothetical protein
MDAQSALTELEALAAKLEVQVVYDRLTGDGVGPGGLCKVRGKWRVIIERQGSPSEKVSILAQALVRFDLESHFVSPGVREILDRYRPATASAPVPAPTPETAADPVDPRAEVTPGLASPEDGSPV